MEIQPITPISVPTIAFKQTSGHPVSFEGLLGQAVQNLSQVQARADHLAIGLATGEETNLVDAVLAMEETSLSFQLAIQVRNKVIEAYQEIMRMQV